VRESASGVDIRATAHIEGGDCTADLVFEEHTVTLDEPLGGRRLTGCLQLGSDANPTCTELAD
jgi:hypothetical protein